MPPKLAVKKIPLFFAVLILAAAFVLVLTLFKEDLFPPPLSLPPGVEISVRWRLEEPGPFHIGDLIPVCLEVEAVDGIDLRLFPLSPADLGGLELVAEETPVTKRRRGGWQRIARYFLSPWRTGTYRLAPKEIRYRNPSGVEATVTAEPLEINVASLLPANLSADEQAALTLKEDKGPVGLPPNYRLLALALAAAIFGLFLYLLFRRFFRKPGAKDHLEPETAPPAEPPHLIARRRLAALKEAGLLENGLFKPYYSELSACLREYLANRFALPALEMTTAEILNSVPQRTGLLTPEQYSALTQILNMSDLVKFAKHRPTAEAAFACFLLVEKFIEETKEEPSIEQNPEDASAASS